MKVTKFAVLLLAVAVPAGTMFAQMVPPQQRMPMPPDQQQQQQPGMPGADDGNGPEDEEGPGRGVARISLMNGDVSVKRGDTADVVAAAINAPLMVNDRIMTGGGARAEIQFDSANLLRMGSVTEVQLAELEWQRYMIQIASGTVTFRVIRNLEAQVEINTPTVALRPLKKGEYRITVREDGTTEIIVRSGELEVVTPRGSERLKSGRMMLARGTSNDAEFQVVNAPPKDDFDRWNQDRDRYFERSQAYDNMSADIYGGEDLDGNGSWTNSPQYGRVWVPRVSAGWAPYQNGRWVYYDWYGWTWVSYDTWGWAPYHYGRWFHDASIGWGWWPGGRASRHYWRPAYVSFFGWGGRGGGGFNVGFGFGNVGWVPLAPYERCYGWWGRNRYNGWRNNNYINNTTIVNNVNITNIYRNARVNNGITSVSVNDFGRNRISSGNMIRTRPDDLRGAGMVRGNLPVVPDRNSSLRFTDRDARYTGNPRLAGNDNNNRFFRTREPARVDRVSFDDQRRGMEDLSRRAAFRGANDGNNSNPGASLRGRDNVGGNSNGWRRAGEGAGRGDLGSGGRGGGDSRGVLASPGDNNNNNSGSRGGGWRRFGESSRGSIGMGGNGNNDQPGPGAVSPSDGNNNSRGGRGNRGDLGSPAPGGGRNSIVPGDGNERGGTGGRESGWQRFGGRSGRGGDSPSTPSSPAVIDRGSRGGGASNNDRPSMPSWRRTDDNGGGGSSRTSRPASPRMESPRVMESPRPERSAPTVRERPSMPTFSRPERSNGGGGRSFEPRSSGGGGGGGGARMGGGGGGARMSGGGGGGGASPRGGGGGGGGRGGGGGGRGGRGN